MNRQKKTSPQTKSTITLMALGWIGLSVVLFNPKIGYTERGGTDVVIFGDDDVEATQLEVVLSPDEPKIGSLLDFLLTAGAEDALSIHEMASLYTDVQRLRKEKFRVYKKNEELDYIVYPLSTYKHLRIEFHPFPDVFIDELPLDAQFEILSLSGADAWDNRLPLSEKLVGGLAPIIDQARDVQNSLSDDAEIQLAVHASYDEEKLELIDNVFAIHVRDNGKETTLYQYPLESGNWFNANGQPKTHAFMRSPLDYVIISSPFGVKRGHKRHKGVDYAAPIGTPIRATAAGKVSEAKYSGAYGKQVRIYHSEIELTSAYAHMSTMYVKSGDFVEKGQIIGKVGLTGRTTGPHLHYEVMRKTRRINPLRNKMKHIEKLSTEDEQSFNAYQSIVESAFQGASLQFHDELNTWLNEQNAQTDAY
jgi:murein DD-endopeptidase MepM/ murein hydrolase activator NlpD